MSDATTIKRACFYKNQIKGFNEKDSPTSLKSNSLFIPQEDQATSHHSDQRSLLQLRIRDEDIPSDDEDSENFESRDLDE